MPPLLFSSPELTVPQFLSISQTVKHLSGIDLRHGKRELVRSRLNKRLRTLGLDGFDQYMDRIATDKTEVAAMLDALSTNLTYFFREPRHFQILKDSIVPAAVRRHWQDRRLRLWSAGCSSGEEPYSIAITLKDCLPDPAAWDVRVLATDLSSRMLRAAQEGAYGRDRLRTASREVLAENFVRLGSGPGGAYRIKGPARDMVTFARLNLMDPWPMRGPFDVIFCRNVMIYFEKPTQKQLVERFWEMLAPEGVLLIGHSESLTGIPHRFRYLEPTVYQKA